MLLMMASSLAAGLLLLLFFSWGRIRSARLRERKSIFGEKALSPKTSRPGILLKKGNDTIVTTTGFRKYEMFFHNN